MAETLTATAGFYSPLLDATLFPPLDNPDNDIALQDDRTFQIGLAAAPGFENVVEFGANIGYDQTFATANVTITDNDSETCTCTILLYLIYEACTYCNYFFWEVFRLHRNVPLKKNTISSSLKTHSLLHAYINS